MKESIFFRSLELCLNSAGTLQIFRNFFEALERTNFERFAFGFFEDLFTKVALKWNYDIQPAEGIEKIDRSFTIGLNYNW